MICKECGGSDEVMKIKFFLSECCRKKIQIVEDKLDGYVYYCEQCGDECGVVNESAKEEK